MEQPRIVISFAAWIVLFLSLLVSRAIISNRGQSLSGRHVGIVACVALKRQQWVSHTQLTVV